MSDMYFENLPSTTTPLTAENLNKLNDIKVSSTQPSTGEKVWFKNSTEKKIYIKNGNNYDEFNPKTPIVKLATADITNLNGTVATNSTYKLENLVGVNLKINGVTISTTGSASTVATLPTGYYSTAECSLIAYSSSGQLIPAWIGTTGNIRISPSSALSNAEIRIIGSYYVY